MAPGGLAMNGGTGRASDEPSQTGNRRWDTSPLSMTSPNDRTPIAIPMLAPIPSPLARFSWSDARHLDRVDERASTGVRELFGRVRQVDSQRDGRFDLRLAMLVGSLPMISPLTIERESGFMAYLERKMHDRAEEEQSHDLTSFQLRYEWITDNNHFIKLDAVQPLPYQRSAQPGQSVPRWASHLDIRRLSSINSAADTIQRFFIYSSANTPLRVNGVMYETNAVLGPLPDFAVIEVGETAVLWWHTDESIDYLPSLRDEIEESKKHPLNIGEDYINLSNTRPSKKQRLEEGSEVPRQTSSPATSSPAISSSDIPSRNPTPSPPPLAATRPPKTKEEQKRDLPSPPLRPSKKQRFAEGSEIPRQTSSPATYSSDIPSRNPTPSPPILMAPTRPIPRWKRKRNSPKPPLLSPLLAAQRPPPSWLSRKRVWSKPPPPRETIPGPNLPLKGAPELTKQLSPPPPMVPPKKPGKAPKPPSLGPPQKPTDPPKKPGKPTTGGLRQPPHLVGTISGFGIAAWRLEFQRRLKEMQAKASKTPDDENSAHQIASPDFRYSDAAMAIASVWKGAKIGGIRYAFGNARLFRYARRRIWSNLASIEASHPLIIPLEFSKSIIDPAPEEESDVKPVPPKKSVEQMRKEEQGILKAEKIAIKKRMNTKSGAEKWDTGPEQFALAIAQRDPSSETGVFITYLNNASTRSQGIIRAAVRNVVRNSSWMPEGTWPNFTREVWQTVPQQTDKFAGGIYLVLNAWAHMLNITINETWSISSEEQENFYKEARTVINLALRGHMNGDTILSLLTAYEYARTQSTSQVGQLPRNMQSVFMHHDVLNDTVDRMRKEDNKKEGGTTAPPTATGPVVQPLPVTKNPLLPPKRAPPRRPRGAILVKGETEWADTLQTRLDACEAKYKNLGKAELYTVRREQLSDDDVILGIAAVWLGLWTDGLHFAFGTANLFRLSRTASAAGEWHGSLSVGAPNDYIMPLLFNPDDTETRKRRIGSRRSWAGHFLLAIASRDSADSTDVTIQIQDSLSGAKDLVHTRSTVQNIVRYSGWMGLTPEGMPVDVQPNFAEEIVTGPQQTGTIECGFHVIFNAWAYMLGIPLVDGSERSGTLPDADFIKCGVRIVNLALGGCLDSSTIQAFFNHFGYCEAQDPADAVEAMESVMMDDQILTDIIEEIVDEEKAIAAARSPPQGPARGHARDGDEDGEGD